MGYQTCGKGAVVCLNIQVVEVNAHVHMHNWELTKAMLLLKPRGLSHETLLLISIFVHGENQFAYNMWQNNTSSVQFQLQNKSIFSENFQRVECVMILRMSPVTLMFIFLFITLELFFFLCFFHCQHHCHITATCLYVFDVDSPSTCIVMYVTFSVLYIACA